MPLIKQVLNHLCLLLLLYSGLTKASEIPVIAAAASIKFAVQDIATAFRKQTGKSVRFSFASSGSLTRQIQQGAPFEIFLSANGQYVERLQEQGLANTGSVIFAVGRLVIITADNSTLKLDNGLLGLEEAVRNRRLQRLAIANPEHAPYGVAAEQALKHQNLWSLLQPHLVFGENVAQAAQFTGSGAAQAGLVSYSLALAPGLKENSRHVLIPQDYYQPLAQTMVLLDNAGETARQFYHFMQQDQARNILAQYGFTAP